MPEVEPPQPPERPRRIPGRGALFWKWNFHRRRPGAEALVEPPAAPGVIQLQVEDVRQLFHALDPLPFHEKDIDPEVEAFVVDWARELRRSLSPEIIIHAPGAQAGAPETLEVESAMRRYFSGRAAALRRQHRELLRTGRASLAVGLGVLAACSLLAPLIARLAPGELAAFLAEGLIILGWVANWRPIEIFLYDWWPLLERRRLYEWLSGCRVRFAPVPPTPRSAG